MKERPISKWKGIWRDDKGRFLEIESYETPEGLAVGYYIGSVGIHRLLFRDGTEVLDGSKLMEKKRGEEKGWPI